MTAAADAPAYRLTVSVPPGPLREALGPLPDDVELLEWDLDGPAPRPHIDLVVRPNVRGLAPLEWLSTVTTRLVQSPAIGFDGVSGVLPPGHRLANAAGVHEDSTAELAVTLVLAAQRDLPFYVQAADQGRWATRISPGLSGRTVLLLGVGGVGQAVEARLRPFGPEIVKVARVARDGVHGVDELPTLLPEADVVVVAVRLDDGTVRLVDAGFLARMRDGALLVNVARGAVVDTRRRGGRDLDRSAAGGSRRHRPRTAATGPPALAHTGRPRHPARGRGDARRDPADGPPGAGAGGPDAGRRAAAERRGPLLRIARRPSVSGCR